MQNRYKTQRFKKYAYVTVSCFALTSCLGVFEKQPDRYNTVVGAKRAPLKNPKTQKAAVVGTSDMRSPSGNPMAPNEPLTPYDRYPSSPAPAPQPSTFQSDEVVEEVPMSLNAPAYIEDEGFITSSGVAEPSPLYYYEQQQANIQSEPLESAPAHVIATDIPQPAPATIDEMYAPSPDMMAQPQYEPMADETYAQAPAQNYIPVIEETPSPLQQFEPQANAFPELASVPPAPDYQQNYEEIRSDAESFANQYSPEIAANIPDSVNNFEQQPAAIIESSPSPLAQMEYAPAPQEMAGMSAQPQSTLEPVQSYYEQPEQIAYPREEPRVREFVPEPQGEPLLAAQPVTQQEYAAQLSVPSYPQQPAYEQQYSQQPVNTANIDFSQQPIALPPQPAYEPVEVEVAALPANEYVTQSEYSMEDITAAPVTQQQPVYQPVAPQAAPAYQAPMQQQASLQPNIYEEELMPVYDPAKNTIAVGDAPVVAEPQRVYTSAGPITLTPPPSMRARRGERIAQSKYNTLRRMRGTTRATLRH